MPTLSRKLRLESVCIRVGLGLSIHIEKLGRIHDRMTEIAEGKAVGLRGAIRYVSVSVLAFPTGGQCFEQSNGSHCLRPGGQATECDLIDPSNLSGWVEANVLNDAISET